MHTGFMVAAILCTSYVLAFPLGLTYVIWKHAHKTDVIDITETKQSPVLLGLRFLYENYTDQLWFWECLDLLKKCLIVAGLSAVGFQGRAYVTMAAVLLVGFMLAQALLKPLTDAFEDRMQHLCTCALVFVLVTSQSMTEMADVEEGESAPVVRGVLIMLAGLLVLFAFCGKWRSH